MSELMKKQVKELLKKHRGDPKPLKNLSKDQIYPSQYVRESETIPIAANPKLSVTYNITKQTRSYKQYIDHPHVPRQSIHSTCSCHLRTYLRPHNDYFSCEKCGEIHHIHCDESPYQDYSDFSNIRYDRGEVKCGWCAHLDTLKSEENTIEARTSEIEKLKSQSKEICNLYKKLDQISLKHRHRSSQNPPT